MFAASARTVSVPRNCTFSNTRSVHAATVTFPTIMRSLSVVPLYSEIVKPFEKLKEVVEDMQKNKEKVCIILLQDYRQKIVSL